MNKVTRQVTYNFCRDDCCGGRTRTDDLCLWDTADNHLPHPAMLLIETGFEPSTCFPVQLANQPTPFYRALYTTIKRQFRTCQSQVNYSWDLQSGQDSNLYLRDPPLNSKPLWIECLPVSPPDYVARLSEPSSIYNVYANRETLRIRYGIRTRDSS